MKAGLLGSTLFLSSLLIPHSVPTVVAEEFVYQTICEPKEMEDVGRVVRGHIWLALRSDKTIRSHSLYVGVRKADFEKRWIPESELLQGLGLAFDSSSLEMSIGGQAEGHACFANGTLIVDIMVERKDGTTQANSFTTPIKLPGAYATKSKFISE